MANCHVVNEGNSRVVELEKKAKEVKLMKKADQSVNLLNKAKMAHAEWVSKGRLVDENRSQNLDRPSSYSVVKVSCRGLTLRGS